MNKIIKIFCHVIYFCNDDGGGGKIKKKILNRVLKLNNELSIY